MWLILVLAETLISNPRAFHRDRPQLGNQGLLVAETTAAEPGCYVHGFVGQVADPGWH